MWKLKSEKKWPKKQQINQHQENKKKQKMNQIVFFISIYRLEPLVSWLMIED